MSEAKITNIAKNTSYFTFALILQKILSFTYFTIVARALGPENLGKYYFAISFTTIFSIFIDLGLVNVLTREVARLRQGFSGQAKYRDRARDLLGSVMAIKLPLAAISLIALSVLINLLGYPELTKNLVYLSAVCMLLDSFTMTFFAVLRGFHNLVFESVSSVIFQVIVITFGLTVLRYDLGLVWLMGALVFASIFNFTYAAALTRFKYKIRIKPRLNIKLIKLILKIAIPFGMFAIFQKLFMYLDTVFLSMLAGDRHVGLYQIAFKIVFALQFLPLAFIASLYPAFASYWKNNKEQLVITFERAMNYLIIISLPISVGIIVLADKIILLFKEGYDEAILPLRIIMASLIFIFLNFPIGSLLNACDKQKINTRNMGITLVVAIVMNIALIPIYKTIGASITVVVANLTMFILSISQVPKIIPLRLKKILLPFLKAFLSVALMAITAFYLKNVLNIFIVITISGIVYFVFLFLFGGFRKEDVLSIWRSFIKKSV